jgi:hypothetical protein
MSISPVSHAVIETTNDNDSNDYENNKNNNDDNSNDDYNDDGDIIIIYC